MRNRSNHIALAFVSVFGLSVLGYAQLGGSGGVNIPYSGKLDSAGAPANGPYDFRFSVFNAASGGNACDTHSETIMVTDGAFSAVIGPVDDTCVRGLDVYLGVEVSLDQAVNGYTPLVGRQRLYAASSAATSGSGDFAVQGNVDVVGNVNASSVFASGVVSSGSVSTGAIGATGVTSNGNILAANAEIGEVGYGPDWAGFSHKNAAADNYALLQDVNTNLTIVNSNAGGNIEFRFGNTTRGGINSAGTLYSANGNAIGAQERLGVVRGTINGNGTVNRGVGYTVSRPANGVLDITFNPPFTGNPTVTCAAIHPNAGLQGGGVGHCMPSHPNNMTASSVRLNVHDGNNGNASFPVSFIAIGPR